MDEEFSIENFTPFITRSRTVTRLLPEPIYPHSPLTNPEQRYGPEFWDRLIRQPSVYNNGVPRSEGPLYTSSTSQNRRTDGKWQQHDHMASPILDPLPPPSEVFRGKKKKHHADRGVISVENHIQDLRKKQGSIDQLKTMKWGGCNIYEMQNKAMEMQSYGARAHQERDPFFILPDDGTEQDRPFFNFSPPRSPGGVVFPWMAPKEDVSTCFLDRTFDDCQSAGDSVPNTMTWRGHNIQGVKNKERRHNDGCRGVQKRDTFLRFPDDEIGCSEKNAPFFSFSPPRSPGGVMFPWMTPRKDASTCFLDRTYDI